MSLSWEVENVPSSQACSTSHIPDSQSALWSWLASASFTTSSGGRIRRVHPKVPAHKNASVSTQVKFIIKKQLSSSTCNSHVEFYFPTLGLLHKLFINIIHKWVGRINIIHKLSHSVTNISILTITLFTLLAP